MSKQNSNNNNQNNTKKRNPRRRKNKTKELEELKQIKQMLKSRKPRQRKGQDRGVSLSKVPASMGVDYKVGAPLFKTSRPGSIMLCHREMIAPIPGTEDLEMQVFSVNPGIEETFPWLSTVANGFEKFDIKRMTIHYVPICSTAENGTLAMYPEYDVEDPPLTNISKILNMEGAVSGALWKPHSMRIEPKKFNQVKSYLIRSPYIIPDDVLLYDPVKINVGVKGAGDTVDVGLLYIDYEIELLVPSTDSGINLDFGLLEWTAAQMLEIEGHWAPMIGNAPNVIKCGNFPWKFINNGTTIYFEDAWVGMVVFYVQVANGYSVSGSIPYTLFTGGGTGFLYGFSIEDTTTFGMKDSLTFYQIINMPAKSTFCPAGGYTGSDSQNDGTIAFYPCTPAYWNSPDPKTISPYSLPLEAFQKLKLEKEESVAKETIDLKGNMKKSSKTPHGPPR